ncbi:MAG: hypothetical protein GY801_04260 [bacterium]|nr:hypothetical protein [bacterium]
MAFSQSQFNVIVPGARVTALGSAFIGLADDATAAVSNPAGLTALTVPELSVEIRHISYTTEHIYENRSPETEIIKREFNDSVGSVPFVGLVYPYKRFAFTLYRQESVKYKNAYRTSVFPIAIPGTAQYLPPIDASVDLAATNYGIGVAMQVFEGFSVAVSPRRDHMQLKSHSTYFGLTTFPGPTDFSETDVLRSSETDDEDIGYSVNAGLLWKFHPKASIGTVYRSGPKFTISGTALGQELYNPDVAEFTVKIPDSFGVGVALRPTGFLTLTLDVVYIHYEDLLEDFDIIFGPNVYSKENYTVDNATEFHAGAEYILKLGEQFLALRAGVYNNPDHTFRFTGTTGDPESDRLGKETFPSADDQIHLTGGVGLVVGDHFQIDAATDIADKSTQLGLSAIYRF